ncbi:MAG TPA: MmcB family DNA repair protein [Vineibacter sp.]|nr:MmcB family DNA repair protein [Vineibacter sp.]
MSILVNPTPPEAATSSRPDVTLAVTRGVCRFWRLRVWTPLLEVPLADGRRGDVLAVGEDGTIAIAEIKSSLEDFRADGKWEDYLAWCDRFYFAVPGDFPLHALPDTVGLIVADGYGGEMLRQDPRPVNETRLVAARRKALMLRCARLAAERLQRLYDPQAALTP